MHSRRIACFLLGIWFGGGMFMQWISMENYRAVDRLLDRPNPATLRLRDLGPTATRLVLRFQVTEQNRYYLESWEIAQLMLGTLFFFFLLFGTREDKFSLLMALLMLLAVAAQRFFITPALNSLSKPFDFVPMDAHPEGGRLHIAETAYRTVELTKLGIGLLLLARLIVGRRRSGDARQQLDLINKANYRHIDR